MLFLTRVLRMLRNRKKQSGKSFGGHPVQTALDEISNCPATILDDIKLEGKHDFVLINIPNDEKEYHLNIIPTNRPGNNCHLHLIGKSFAQRFIPLLSPSDEAIPIGLQNINHQDIPDIEIDKHNKETTIQTIEKNIQFNTTLWPLEYTSCLSLKDLTYAKILMKNSINTNY